MEQWHASYRGVGFRIKKWRFGFDDEPRTRDLGADGWVWNYYMLVPEAQIPDDWRDRLVLTGEKNEDSRHAYYEYSASPWGDLPWPGGITWYEKRGGLDGAGVIVETGCDHAHSWDEGRRYDVDYVLSEVMGTIDALRELVPNLKWRCDYNGGYYDVANGMLNPETDSFRSHEGNAQAKKWREEHEHPD
jgi:hypothetical protein